MEKNQKKNDNEVRKGRKFIIHYIFPIICGSGGSKSNLAKVASAEPNDQIRNTKLYAIIMQNIFLNQKY